MENEDLEEEYLKSLVEKPEEESIFSYFKKLLFLIPATVLVLLTVGSFTMLTWLQKMF